VVRPRESLYCTQCITPMPTSPNSPSTRSFSISSQSISVLKQNATSKFVILIDIIS
jgi:hypothetical protein